METNSCISYWASNNFFKLAINYYFSNYFLAVLEEICLNVCVFSENKADSFQMSSNKNIFSIWRLAKEVLFISLRSLWTIVLKMTDNAEAVLRKGPPPKKTLIRIGKVEVPYYAWLGASREGDEWWGGLPFWQ